MSLFFPYVVSGPIAYHSEIIPQFQTATAGKFNLAHVSAGLFMFAIGLFKKTAIADTLAVISDGGHAASVLTFTEAWLTSLSYTMQLYFDFSGYTDMAIAPRCFQHLPADQLRFALQGAQHQGILAALAYDLSRFLAQLRLRSHGGQPQGRGPDALQHHGPFF
jgi:hypothetical protein